ncbi:helix-turn-helix domain-containing protein [Companilactobacillus kimchii]|uniref:Xre-like DNA-binding protein n=2 Tax=Companilactobacillus kimchii TaxID=2801452 RepID=A0ABR5NV28_9LACO|nr:RodZ domain-containing protein [Companilactobacillus kimchii]KAE9563166.1 XRE family transcriptional regulator [Companilactobacillus kimchii]KRK52686.1 Xre-like DNA-binding protein [Companilactobacillus kimchii DSM 13961 = JCM 10707]OWF32337.1 putative membrane protein YmfM [Companilactobacillus kimchii]GEO47273.1 XRE family transcriptional regulator [Companilactobacillus paralimentarius]
MDEIGQKLRNARIKKGYTIDDLQQITKIQKRYLIAIEEGQFDHLPGDFYVRAFIKQYSDAVGISSDDLLEEYKADIPNSQPSQEAIQQETKTRSIKEESNSFFSNLGNYIPQIVVGIVVIVIIAVIAFGMVHRNQNASSVTIPKDSTTQTTKKKTTKKSTKTTKKATAKKKAAAKTVSVKSSGDNTYTVTNMPTDGLKVVVAGNNGQAWIQFTEGSNTTWQQALSSGEKKETTVPADTTSFKIQTGNINNTEITIDGKKLDLGTTDSSSSIVKTLTFNVEK